MRILRGFGGGGATGLSQNTYGGKLVADKVKFNTKGGNVTVFLGKVPIIDNFYSRISNQGYTEPAIIK